MGINRGSTVTPTGGPRARSLVALAACRELQVKPDPHARELARWRSAPRLSLYSATLSDKHDGLARGCASTAPRVRFQAIDGAQNGCRRPVLHDHELVSARASTALHHPQARRSRLHDQCWSVGHEALLV